MSPPPFLEQQKGKTSRIMAIDTKIDCHGFGMLSLSISYLIALCTLYIIYSKIVHMQFYFYEPD